MEPFLRILYTHADDDAKHPLPTKLKSYTNETLDICLHITYKSTHRSSRYFLLS